MGAEGICGLHMDVTAVQFGEVALNTTVGRSGVGAKRKCDEA